MTKKQDVDRKGREYIKEIGFMKAGFDFNNIHFSKALELERKQAQQELWDEINSLNDTLSRRLFNSLKWEKIKKKFGLDEDF